MDDTPVLRRRIHFLDEVRGFDLILMVFFHGFYMLGWIYDVAFGRTLFQFFRPVQPLLPGCSSLSAAFPAICPTATPAAA